MINKKFIVWDCVFIASFCSFESLREFEKETGLQGVNIG